MSESCADLTERVYEILLKSFDPLNDTIKAFHEAGWDMIERDSQSTCGHALLCLPKEPRGNILCISCGAEWSHRANCYDPPLFERTESPPYPLPDRLSKITHSIGRYKCPDCPAIFDHPTNFENHCKENKHGAYRKEGANE